MAKWWVYVLASTLCVGCVFGETKPTEDTPDQAAPTDAGDVGLPDTASAGDAGGCDCAPADHAVSQCVDGSCVYECELGWANEDDTPDCEAEIADIPGDGEDTNGDGVDGVLELSVYVSATRGRPNATGLTPQDPVQNMWDAIKAANMNSRPYILVETGEYDGGWSVTNRRLFFGGYDAEFTTPAGRATVTRPPNPPSGVMANDYAVRVEGASEVMFTNFTFRTQGSEFGQPVPVTAFLNGSAVIFTNCEIYGAEGAAGEPGVNGVPGRAGGAGGIGKHYVITNDGGSGGTNAACPSAVGGAGGRGLECPAAVSEDGMAAPSPGGGRGGAGGAAGCAAGSPEDGETGSVGAFGPGGGPVQPTDAGAGSWSGEWIPTASRPGLPGADGAGGGGGGGGGPVVGAAGVAGSGGGAGGCGGAGGAAGAPGGASFAVIAVGSQVRFIDSRVFPGKGGAGGPGGDGGCGGQGGDGGATYPPGSMQGAGGEGGSGGGGGHGGPGHGGHGGPVFGIAGVGFEVVAPDGTVVGGEGGPGGPAGSVNPGCPVEALRLGAPGAPGAVGGVYPIHRFEP